MGDTYKNMELLYDRPNEPLLTPKGVNNVVFDLTDQFLAPGYEDNGIAINSRFGEDASIKIKLQKLDIVPDFPLASKLPKDGNFSLFLPKHQAMANEVINTLMSVPVQQLEILLSTCVVAREKLNPELFNYCYTVVLLHRPDTKKVKIKNFIEVFPAKFMDSQVFREARETAAVIPPDVPRIPVIIPRDYTASDLEAEHRVAYWREDLGINQHHWHWHIIYPFDAGDRRIVDKDRRGELFFFMHQQMIARYNCERLCNSLRRVVKFSNWREPIPEAYFPKLDSLTSSRSWPPRQSGMRWQDLKRPADGIDVTIDQMEQWRKNIEEAISTGTVQLPNGKTQRLTIDILGNMLEASILSPNKELYGSIHNTGHSFGAYMHDPEHKYLESFSVLADEATTMRDPFFYRWHAWIDDTFQKHKESIYVNPYTKSQLENVGVNVTSVTIKTKGYPDNTLNTFWMQSDVDLSRGLDFSERGPVYVRFTHLNHRPFRYEIKVNSGSARRTTVRIFIAPKFDERNLLWILSDQRKMFIEMDRFVTTLNAGQNTIIRQSTESALTIPFEQTFRDLSVQGSDPKREELAGFNYCGCGWPQHMLVPKGTVSGVPYQLFVMFSNYELDKVVQPDGKQLSCVEASVLCGLKNKLYPDRRPLGFPFDRPSRSARNIDDFILSNMALKDITIRLQNVTEENPKNRV